MRLRHLVVAALVWAVPAVAQQKDDEPIPYGDEPEEQPTAKPKKSKKHERLREEEESEVAGLETLTHLDDPNIGLGGDLIAGAMLLESSRGGGTDPRFLFGVRFTWEWGRLIADEFLRELFFADLTWQFTSTSDGTTEVHGEATQHYFTAAQAVAWPLGKSFMSAYAELGAGLNLDFSSVTVDKATTQITGAKFLFQYGIGLRGRPALTDPGWFRLEFRIELTRFVRGYMNDTLLGGSVGVVF